MLTVTDLIPVYVFLGLAVGELHIYVLRKRERITRNTQRIKVAADNLNHHSKSFDRFYGDAEAPDDLKEILLHFSEAIGHSETALYCVKGLTTNPTLDPSDDIKRVLAQLAGLRSRRPDLAESFDSTIMSGLMYMLLRWPDTSKLFEEATSRIVTDPTRGVGFATRAARMAKPRLGYQGIAPRPEFAAV